MRCFSHAEFISASLNSLKSKDPEASSGLAYDELAYWQWTYISLFQDFRVSISLNPLPVNIKIEESYFCFNCK
jgi:hypothetical protein